MSTLLTWFLKEASASELPMCIPSLDHITGPICNVHVQYRPRALQHYTRVSCVEIHHIARKFHEKNTRKHSYKNIQAKILEKKLVSYRWLYLSWESENCLNFSGYSLVV